MGKPWFSMLVPKVPWHEDQDQAKQVTSQATTKTVEDWRAELPDEPAHGTDEHGDCACEDCGCGEKWSEDTVLDSGRGK